MWKKDVELRFSTFFVFISCSIFDKISVFRNITQHPAMYPDNSAVILTPNLPSTYESLLTKTEPSHFLKSKRQLEFEESSAKSLYFCSEASS